MGDIDRMLARLEEKGLTEADLAKWLGVRHQVIYNWKSRGKIPGDRLSSVARFLMVNTDWLQHGTGEKERQGEGEVSNIESGPQIQRGVPLISWVQAGDPEIVADPYQPGDADEWLPCPVPCSERTFALKVSGPSMEPEYHDGEIIFVDPDVETKPNDDVVVRFDDIDHAVFKRLRYDEGGTPYLEAVNEAWRPRYQELNEHAAICGKVIFSGKPR